MTSPFCDLALSIQDNPTGTTESAAWKLLDAAHHTAIYLRFLPEEIRQEYYGLLEAITRDSRGKEARLVVTTLLRSH